MCQYRAQIACLVLAHKYIRRLMAALVSAVASMYPCVIIETFYLTLAELHMRLQRGNQKSHLACLAEARMKTMSMHAYALCAQMHKPRAAAELM